MIELFFDTETTGLPQDWGADYKDDGHPDLVQLGAILASKDSPNHPARIHQTINLILEPEPWWRMGEQAVQTHGISIERAKAVGQPGLHALGTFINMLARADQVVCHNLDFDRLILQVAIWRQGRTDGIGQEIAERQIEQLTNKKSFCTMKASTPILNLPGGRNGQPKWPRLEEVYRHFFGRDFPNAHDALSDVKATAAVYYRLKFMEGSK